MRCELGALVLAMLLVLLLLGPRTDMPGALATPAFLMKAMFLLAVVATGLRGLLRAARAGEEKRHALRLVLLPLALVWIAAAAQLDVAEHRAVLDAALAEAAERGITGHDTTPFLLDHVHRATAGRSLDVNVAVYRGNVALAGEVAAALAAEQGVV